jgi:hypothetical protein
MTDNYFPHVKKNRKEKSFLKETGMNRQEFIGGLLKSDHMPPHLRTSPGNGGARLYQHVDSP